MGGSRKAPPAFGDGETRARKEGRTRTNECRVENEAENESENEAQNEAENENESENRNERRTNESENETRTRTSGPGPNAARSKVHRLKTASMAPMRRSSTCRSSASGSRTRSRTAQVSAAEPSAIRK